MISDLASGLNLRVRNTQIRRNLDTVSEELATGKKSNLLKAAGGDVSMLFSLERTIKILASERAAIFVTTGRAELIQLNLDQMQNGIADLGPELLAAVERGDYHAMTLISGSAEDLLMNVVAGLNARHAGNSLFAGAASDQPALASAEILINDIAAIVAAAPDSTTALSSIDSYFFDFGGGFEINIYTGSASSAPAFVDAAGGEHDYAIKADVTEVRKMLRSLTVAVVASSDVGFLGTANQVGLLRDAATSAIEVNGEMIELRERLGFFEGYLSQINAQNVAKSHVFELERNAIIATDPYETATMFEALQNQLETVYTITARLSKLSLVNYLR